MRFNYLNWRIKVINGNGLVQACALSLIPFIFPAVCISAQPKDLSADLKSTDLEVRRIALRALAHPESKDVLKAKYTALLIPIIEERDTLTKWTAVQALGNIGPAAKAAIPTLLKKLKEPRGPDPNMRSLVINTLSKIGPADPSVLNVLSSKVIYGDLKDAESCAMALGSIGKTTLPYFFQALKAPSVCAPYAAAKGLRYMGKDAKPAVPLLLLLMNEKKLSVPNEQLNGGNTRHAAMLSLVAIAPNEQSVLMALKKLSKDSADKPASEEAAKCLSQMAKKTKH